MDGDVKIFPGRRIAGANSAPSWRHAGATLAPKVLGVNGGATMAPLWRHGQCVRIPGLYCGVFAGFRSWETAQPLRLMAIFQGWRRA